MPAASPSIPIDWSIQYIAVGGLTIPLARLLLSPSFPTVSGPLSLPEECWLDTGAPISVVPFHVHQRRLSWQPLGIQTTWQAQQCDLGRIEVWFHIGPGIAPAGPFSLLAKFAQSDPPGDPVPVLLGLEFLLTHHAHLDLAPAPVRGGMQVP